MKVRVTLEFEMADLPDHARAELADGIHFRADDDTETADDLDAVPTMADYSEDEILSEVYEMFGPFGTFGDYESQAELWAGTDFYGYVKNPEVVSCEVVNG